jgi:hypothetical protein
MYGFELKWKRFSRLCKNLSDIFEKLNKKIKKFLENV